jgi:thiamine kinase-like enzyme
MILSFSSIIPYTINQLSWKRDIEKVNMDNFFVLGYYTIREDAGSDNPSRNRCFSIENHIGSTMNYYLKQPKNFNRENINSINREQAFYELIEKYSENDFSEIKKYLPRFYDYNHDDFILILEWINKSQNLRDFREQAIKKVKPIVKGIKGGTTNIPELTLKEKKASFNAGIILNKIHHVLREKEPLFSPQSPFFFNTSPLPIFEIKEEILGFQKKFRPDLKAFISAFENKDLSFRDVILKAKEYWNTAENKTIIHGDFRTANILLKENDFIYFIDWEYAMWGCPEFDLASFYYYELLDNKFGHSDTISTNFKLLLDGYYGESKYDQTIIDKISIFCQARIIDYWCRKSNALNFLAKDDVSNIDNAKSLFKILDILSPFELKLNQNNAPH